MELIKVGERTYYIKNPTNVGVYQIDEKNVYLIDTGNDKDAGKKILKILEENGLTVKGVINTHSNADHIGGNKVIQDRTGCKILAHGIERAFTEFPMLGPAFLYGGYPFKDIQNKFLLAKESNAVEIEGNLPQGLEYFSLKGHFFDMIGIKTDDDVYFLADSVFSQETISKYHLFFIYDVEEYLHTLDLLETLDGRLYIPSHCEATDDIHSLIQVNRDKIQEIANKLVGYCEKEVTFEEILKFVFDDYALTMNPNQYVLIGSTIKSYLSYLQKIGKIQYELKDNRMVWRKVKNNEKDS